MHGRAREAFAQAVEPHRPIGIAHDFDHAIAIEQRGNGLECPSERAGTARLAFGAEWCVQVRLGHGCMDSEMNRV
jgi:hypothetical protein